MWGQCRAHEHTPARGLAGEMVNTISVVSCCNSFLLRLQGRATYYLRSWWSISVEFSGVGVSSRLFLRVTEGSRPRSRTNSVATYGGVARRSITALHRPLFGHVRGEAAARGSTTMIRAAAGPTFIPARKDEHPARGVRWISG